MSEVKGKAVDLNILKRVMTFIKPYRLVFYFTMSLTVVMGFLAPVRPALIQTALDDYVTIEKDTYIEQQIEAGENITLAETDQAWEQFNTTRSEDLLYVILMIVGLLVLESVMQFFQTYYSNWIGQSVTIDLRKDLYGHVMRFRLKYFDRTPIGTLVTRVVSDIDGIAQIFSQGLLTIMGDLLKLVVVIVVMFWLNWKLALIVLIPIPILLWATRIFKNAIKKAFIDVRNQVSKLNAFVQERVTGMSIVQVFSREEKEMEKFMEINDKHRKANIRSVWAYAVFFPVVELLSALSVALLIWLGIYLVADGQIAGVNDGVTYGQLVQYILYVFMLYRPIRQLADRFNTLQMGMVNAERVFKILDKSDVIPNDGTLTEPPLEGNIRFENLWFAYNDEDWVLRDVSFEVKAGETVAFVGSTGSGKTSTINLISRFYEFQKGKLEVEGKPIEDYDINHIRRNIAVVLQDVFLFSDTIINNVTLHDENISREQVIEAAKAVGAHDFIMKLPGNYDYDVRERGGMLSVGQRQLIAFIRAYVYNPNILVLDEATSSVDTESEELIQRAIGKLTENRTSIVIAHRLSTIQQADKIIVMDKGKILESGSHDELLRLGGQYKKLFDLQFS